MGETQTVLPDEDIGSTFMPFSGSTCWEAVSDSSDANYMYLTDSNGGQRLGIADFTFSETAIIGVTMNVRHQANASGAGTCTAQARLRVDGNDYQGSQLATSTSWTDDQEVWLTNPVTSLAWTKDQLNGVAISNNLEAIVGRANNMAAGYELRYSQISLVGEYNPLLIIQDVSSSVSIANSDLTQAHSLTVQDISSAVSIDNSLLTQKHNLTVADIASAVTIDNSVLTQKHNLLINDVTSNVSIDNSVLTQKHTLLISDILSTVSIDNVVLITDTILDIQNITCEVNIDIVNLTQKHDLVIQDLASTISIDNVAITQKHILIVDEVNTSVSVENIVLNYGTGKLNTEKVISKPEMIFSIN